VPQRIPLFCIIDCLHTSVYISVQLCGQQYIVLLLYCNYYDDVTPMDSSTGLRTVVCIHWNALLEMKTHTQHTNMRSCSGERLGILGLLLVPWRHKGWPYLCTHEKNTRIRIAGGVQRLVCPLLRNKLIFGPQRGTRENTRKMSWRLATNIRLIIFDACIVKHQQHC
jgi:hypothetical protein